MTTMMMDAEKDGKPLPMVNGKVRINGWTFRWFLTLKGQGCRVLNHHQLGFVALLQFDYTKDFFQKPAFLTVSGQR